MSKEIELLQKQLAFWKSQTTCLINALDEAEKQANHTAELLDKTEEELNAERVKSEWISVDERLPEPNEDCLVVAKVGDRVVVDMGKRILCWDYRTGEHYCEWMITNDWDEGEGCEITHWMPLPEAPKMKGGDKQ